MNLFRYLLGVSLLVAAATAAAVPTARFSRLSVQDGLSQSSVESIAEDRYGFFWFGTQEGLSRYDGHQFVTYPESTQAGRLQEGFIRAIVPDAKGDLWIGTETGLQHLDVATGRFEPSITPEGIGVRLNALVISKSGRLWFAGGSGGLWTVAPAGASQAERVATDVIGEREIVRAITQTRDGRMWLTTDDRLLLIEPADDSGTVKATLRLRGTMFGRVLHVDGNGHVWIARWGKPVLRFDPASGTTTEFGQLPLFTLAIAAADDGQLWFGGRDAGLVRFDPVTGKTETFRHEPGNEESLAENDVAVLHQDRAGSLWIGAWNGGISRLNLYAQAFRTVRNNPAEPRSLPDNDVTQMTEGPDGRLWVMTRNDVLAAGDPTEGHFVRIPFEGDLTAIAAAGSRLYAGTATGLVALDPRSGRRMPISETLRRAGLDRERITALEGTPADLWIVASGSLFRLALADETLLRAALPQQGEPTSLFANERRELWISYAEGVLARARVSADGTLEAKPYGSSIASRGRFVAVAEDRGVVWLGTARGLGRITLPGESADWVELHDGNVSRSVASILADSRGFLWIPTNHGITRFNPVTGRGVHFGGVQGAQASGYVDGGAASMRSGHFLFAGRGLTVFHPNDVKDNPFRPSVVFTTLEILHRRVPPAWIDPSSPLLTAIHAARELTLGPDVAVFSVEMAAPGVSDPRRIVFAHKLDGFDQDWIETTAQRRFATYTRLRPGDYVLRARARTESGRWSESETTLVIHVIPPWWKTRWAMAAWTALGLLLIALIVVEARRRTHVRIALAEQEALRRASMTDPLTGLYNRRFFASWMRHEVARVLRTHRNGGSRESLLFVIIDLDRLKEINDEHGHADGDRAIVAVAEVLQSQTRAEDLAVRWGGDEFVFVSRSRRDQSEEIVERLRSAVESVELEGRRVSVSIGFACFPFIESDPESLTVEQVMQIADRALLASKRRGRNTWTGIVATASVTARTMMEYVKSSPDLSPPSGIVEVSPLRPRQEVLSPGDAER